MMVILRKEGRIIHDLFSSLPSYLRKGDVLVVNNSKVINARLKMKKIPGGGRVIALFVEKDRETIKFYKERGKKLHEKDEVSIGDENLRGEVVKVEGRFFYIKLKTECDDEKLFGQGSLPLPPYIKRESESIDMERYQTIFAQHPGSIASPTAGLHFTEEMVEKLREMGVEIVSVTLHVSIGTFLPISKEDVREHKIYPEFFNIPEESAQKINTALREGRRVICVGTTTVRCLESAFFEKEVKPLSGVTSLYIYPPYEFRVARGLLTNFHLPGSSLLLLVCAFGGYELVMRGYREAVEKGYRFYSYGDCTLIL